ncbi:hypothetical protein K457DRAFT_21840 [Linnemannia elongata AG-77]|uniref:RNI-like protein n=1 Tax=Linnemannia elongata AG-77 TaxID=1314771 RepID=A0A197JPF2_9FUNG|nr:hypothetical protein K457DRAFT_21840 [Linnemannia elongata AG-77]
MLARPRGAEISRDRRAVASNKLLKRHHQIVYIKELRHNTFRPNSQLPFAQSITSNNTHKNLSQEPANGTPCSIMLTPIVFAVLLLCLSPASAIPQSPIPNLGENASGVYKCNFDQDPVYGSLMSTVRGDLPITMFSDAGLTVPEHVFSLTDDKTDSLGASEICRGKHMASVFPGYPLVTWATTICPVPGVPPHGKDFALCKVTNLVSKAQIRIKKIAFDNSKTDRTTTTETFVKTNFNIKGEIKMAPTFLKALGLEATVSGDYGSEQSIKVTTVQGVKAGYSATCHGHNSILTTLDLQSNSIGDNGAQALAEALKTNSTVTIKGVVCQ